MQIHALVVAAGRGNRFGGDIPKQYLPIDVNKPELGCVLQCSLQALSYSSQIDKCILVVAKDDDYVKTLSFALPVTMVVGGDERWQSVANGVRAIADFANDDDLVLIHDAARPCLRLMDLQRVIDVAKLEPNGAILGVPVADTLKKVADGQIAYTISRDNLWHAQTPQVFRLDKLLTVINYIEQAIDKNITDEAMAFEALGLPIKMVKGSPSNIKLTFAHDLPLVRALLGIVDTL